MKPTVDTTTPGDRSALAKFGPLAGIVAVALVIGIGVILSGGGGDESGVITDDATLPDGTTTTPANPDDVTQPAPTGRMPITYAEAVAAGTVDDYEWGDRCDTERGAVAIPVVYSPPCVPMFEGDNGGATSPGVTATEIVVVRYIAQADDQFTALIAATGAADSREETTDTFMGYLEALSSQGEMYGRTIRIEDYLATGPGEDPVTSQADAETIAEQFRPFVVIGGPATDGGTFAKELARQEIVCFACGLAVPTQFIYDHAPYLWGTTPSVDQFLESLAAWANRAGEAQAATGDEQTLALYAQSEELSSQERKVGIIHFEQDPPLFDATADAQNAAFESTYELRESYLFNLTTMQVRAAELITKMKSEGITTIMFLGDPVMPIFLTQQATTQDYWPEWLFTGTVLTDTNVLGRLYDQEQMRAAYGVSNLPTPVVQDQQDSIELWHWYHGADTFPPARSQYALQLPAPMWLMQGIQMAGPDLTVETLRDGLFRMPPMGGGPTAPQVSYGNWGFFNETDYFAFDDTVEIWWDADANEPDERGCVGTGLWMRAHGGERFTKLDAPLPAPFEPEGAIAIFDEVPESEQIPEYPSPPGSPAAEGTPGRGADTELVDCDG